MSLSKISRGVIAVVLGAGAGSLASRAIAQTVSPYGGLAEDSTACCEERPLDIEVGADAPIIDGIGWVFGIPRKVLLWDRRADNHDVSQGTVDEVATYVDIRGLHDTKVRVNQYDPVGEWKRLVANKEVGAGWRYTAGAISTIGYTIFPGRLFGRDQYNPYTNTLSVYSDAAPLALAEAAYAKDVAERNYPGTYATVQYLPVVAAWHETLATQETLRYTAVEGSQDSPEKVRRLLYARYGTEIGGAVSDVVTASGAEVLLPVAGAIGGHTVATYEEVAEGRSN